MKRLAETLALVLLTVCVGGLIANWAKASESIPITYDTVMVDAEGLIPVAHPLDERIVEFKIASDVWVRCIFSNLNDGRSRAQLAAAVPGTKPFTYGTFEAWQCYKTRLDPDLPPNPNSR